MNPGAPRSSHFFANPTSSTNTLTGIVGAALIHADVAILHIPDEVTSSLSLATPTVMTPHAESKQRTADAA